MRIPANGEYVMICPINRIGFFMSNHLLTITVYSIACQKGGKKRVNGVKKLSRADYLFSLYFVSAFGNKPFTLCSISRDCVRSNALAACDAKFWSK
jgi:hypothetical protein